MRDMSLLDYPGKVSCVVFLPGCNFRCPFCFNPGFVLIPEKQPTIPEGHFFWFLEERRQWLDGVAITGGEPTLSRGLPDFIAEIKKRGYLVCLETNGSNPKMLDELIKEKLLDYIAMDIKGPLERYSEIVGASVNKRDIQRSVDLVRTSGLEYEFRTTFVPGLVGKQDVEKIGIWLKGSRLYGVQRFVPWNTLDKSFETKATFSRKNLEHIAQIAGNFFKNVEIRQ